jgi:hypothetical protein
MHDDSPRQFDFRAYRRAVERKDAPLWLDFFAEDAEWIEYKPTNPPRSPRRMVGRRQIGEFLEQVKSSDVVLEIEDEVIGPTRAAFCLWCVLGDGRRIIEHVIIHLSGATITRQVDVEAWD